MITAVCFLLIVASLPLLGGDLMRVAELRLRHWWTLVVSLALQIVVIFVLPNRLPFAVAAGLHVLSYGPAILFVWFNRTVKGMGIMVLGGLLNLLAIGANGGVMPARADALRTAGLPIDSPEFQNSVVVDDAKLAFLGDVFAVPSGVPFANVFSIGDVLLVFGGAVLVHSVGQSRLARGLGRSPRPTASHEPEHPTAPPSVLGCHERIDDLETQAVLSFLDRYAVWEPSPIDEQTLARHLHAVSPLTRPQAIRFARLVKHGADHPKSASALAARQLTATHLDLLSTATKGRETAYRRDEDRLLALAVTLEPSAFETALRQWVATLERVAVPRP